ncbi:MAG: hypothetical protein AAFR61_12660 [Bacteroidota bacterium]
MLDHDIDISPLTLLKFKDFVPQQLEGINPWTARGKYEPLSHSLQKVNEWMANNPHTEFVNVETVVLPNIHSKKEEGSEDPEIVGAAVYWHQFFRVWYIERTQSEA